MTGHVIADLPATMQSKIRVEGDCWVWTGAKNRKGYGSTAGGARNRSMLAHRKAYETVKGPIPAGLQVDHLCFNTSCVNPSHLEAVTGEENMRRRYARYGAGAVASDTLAVRSAITDLIRRVQLNQQVVAALPEELREEWEAGRRRVHEAVGTLPAERPERVA